MKRTEEVLEEVLEQVKLKKFKQNNPQHWEAVERMIHEVQETEKLFNDVLKKGGKNE